MRIAYTCQNTNIRGGLERIIIDKASALAERGHEVCLIVNNPPGSDHFYAPDPRVHITNISLPQPRGIAATFFFKLRQNLRIIKALRSFKPDITIATPTWLTLGIIFGPGALVLESHCYRPLVYSLEKRRLYKLLKEAVAERIAKVVVALTEEDKKKWSKARKTVVIVNFSNFKPTDIIQTKKGTAISMARLNEQKQLDLLIDTWAIVVKQHPSATLDIYGDGPLRNALQNQINELNLCHNIKLRGNTNNITEAYSSHDFLVLSSKFEGLPLVLIEAFKCGCPCVAVDCTTGPREIISDKKNGLLVPYRDLPRDIVIHNLSSAICKMIEHPELVSSMSAQARKDVLRFDKDIVMKQWENLFMEICQ